MGPGHGGAVDFITMNFMPAKIDDPSTYYTHSTTLLHQMSLIQSHLLVLVPMTHWVHVP